MTQPSTTKSMPRARTVMTMLTSVLLLSACSSDTVPTGTSFPSASRPRLAVTPGVSVCTGQPELQLDIDALLSSGTQQAAFSQFAHVVRSCDPQDLVKTQALAFKLLEFTMQRIRQGQVEIHASPVSARFYQLLVDLYAFVGLGDPGLSPLDVHEAILDGAIGIATPGQVFTLIAGSGNFALRADANYFIAPALVVLGRRSDFVEHFTIAGDPYRTYPPAFSIDVYPENAQRNFGSESEIPPAFASVAVCPGHFGVGEEHDELTNLQVARFEFGIEGYSAELLLASSQAVSLLTCTERDAYSGPPPSTEGPFLDVSVQPTGRFNLFASRVRGAAAWLGGTLASIVTPKNLYAWDGGVGGRTAVLEGDFTAAGPDESS